MKKDRNTTIIAVAALVISLGTSLFGLLEFAALRGADQLIREGQVHHQDQINSLRGCVDLGTKPCPTE